MIKVEQTKLSTSTMLEAMLLVGGVILSACGPSQTSTAADPSLVISSQSLYRQLTTATAAQHVAAIRAIGALSISEYYDAMLAGSGDSTVVVDGKIYAASHKSITVQRADFLELASAFSTVSQMWAAMGIDPHKRSYATFKADLQVLAGDESAGKSAELKLVLRPFSYRPSARCDQLKSQVGVNTDVIASALTYAEYNTREGNGETTVDISTAGASAALTVYFSGAGASRSVSSGRITGIDGSVQAPTTWGNMNAGHSYIPGSKFLLKDCFGVDAPATQNSRGFVVTQPDGSTTNELGQTYVAIPHAAD